MRKEGNYKALNNVALRRLEWRKRKDIRWDETHNLVWNRETLRYYDQDEEVGVII
jgi:hypothetical protein